jgi:serine/threonine-protein kinase
MTTAPEAKATAGGDPLVGMVLDRYRVIEKIGEGGMGAVYAVEHVMLQKRMAMKLLRAELSRNQDLVTRFQNEAISASRIGQENIVAVTDFGRTPDGLVYFVMEELHGKSLAEVIRTEGCLSIMRTMGIAAQVCRALNAAHLVGIVHRDLKPENIVLVARDGMVDFVKVLDFGISKMTEQQPSTRLTQVGMIVGTPEYMSPEQAAGKQVDARSDVYSLGVVLFEMLTGRLPFYGENALQILMKHQTQEPPKLADARPGTSYAPAVEGMVYRALAKKPEERQQSMAECLGDLQRFAEQMRMTQPEMMLPPSGGLTPTDHITGRSPSNPPWIKPDWSSPTTVTPATTAEATLPAIDINRLAPPVSPVPFVPPGPSVPTSVPTSVPAEDFDAASLRPKRTGMWVALGLVVLAGAGLGALALSRRAPPTDNIPLPTPTPVAQPAQALLPPPPTIATPPVQPELAAPPPVIQAAEPAPRPVAPPPEAPAKAPAKASPGHHPRRTAAAAGPAAPKAVQPATPQAPSDPYQKMDDLKSAY